MVEKNETANSYNKYRTMLENIKSKCLPENLIKTTEEGVEYYCFDGLHVCLEGDEIHVFDKEPQFNYDYLGDTKKLVDSNVHFGLNINDEISFEILEGFYNVGSDQLENGEFIMNIDFDQERT